MVKYVEWHFTNRCNLGCLHCMCNSGVEQSDGEKTKEKSIEFLKILKPNCINITGGEPLLSPYVFDTAKKIADKGIVLSLSTNGTVQVSVECLDKIYKLFKGGIQFSLDSVFPETHDYLRQTKGAFERTIEFIRKLRERHKDYDIQICMCLNRYNYRDIPLYKNILEKYQINSFKILSLYRVGRAKKNDLFINEESTIQAINKCEELNSQINGTKVFYSNPEINFEILNEANRILDIEMINIDSQGVIRISPYLPYVIGNVREIDSIDEFARRKKIILDEIKNRGK